MALKAYDRPLERAAHQVEAAYSQDEIDLFCAILDIFSKEYQKDL